MLLKVGGGRGLHHLLVSEFFISKKLFGYCSDLHTRVVGVGPGARVVRGVD